MSNRINDAAHALLHRRTEQQPALLDAATAPQDLVEAYAVHTALLALLTDSGAGAQIGWKVGFTNDAAQARHRTLGDVAGNLHLTGEMEHVGKQPCRGQRRGIELACVNVCLRLVEQRGEVVEHVHESRRAGGIHGEGHGLSCWMK